MTYRNQNGQTPRKVRLLPLPVTGWPDVDLGIPHGEQTRAAQTIKILSPKEQDIMREVCRVKCRT